MPRTPRTTSGAARPPIDTTPIRTTGTPRTLSQLRDEARDCRNCDLWEHATQTVFGEGSPEAPLVFVGEQPGDREDIEGRPFVGPAGALLDEALEAAGIERTDAYVTNAVKHFKFEPRGKRRIHQRPDAREIEACKPWLAAELVAIRPSVLVVLGATAAQSLLGSAFRVTKQRGQLLRDTGLAPVVIATVHPSSILRAPDADARHEQFEAFVADLRVVAEAFSSR